MKKQRQPTTFDLIAYGLILYFLKCLGGIPLPLTRRMGAFLGDFAYGLARKHRQIALCNLAYALGDGSDHEAKRRITRGIFQNLGKILFEVGWSLAVSKDQLNRHIHIQGLEHYHRALQKGRGVLAITAHLGNWELLPAVADRIHLPLNVVYRPLDFMPLELFFSHLRTRFGARIIPSGQAMLRIVRALRREEAVAILIDQSVDWYDGVWVDFFGRPTCTSVGAAMIALKTRCPVLPVFLYREAAGFRAVFDREIPLVSTGDRIGDIERNTQNYSWAIEKAIRRHAEQWFWVHRRWKNKPYCPWPRVQS